MASPSDAGAASRRALVTGIGGFTGRYVAQALTEAGYEVHGLAQSNDDASEHVDVVDLCDRAAMMAYFAERSFDAIVHLAAIAFVAHGDAEAIYRVNVVGTRNLLEALAAAPSQPRVVVLASSANIYGNATVDPIDESTPPAPANDYAVSKVAMEMMASLWCDRLPIVVTRPFNYTGVGQGGQFLIPKIVDHFRRRAPVIELGNTDVEREFNDVRDVAKLYLALVERAPVGKTFNLCAGVGYTLDDVLVMAGDLAGYRIEVKVNPAFVRSKEVKRLVGSPAAIRRLVPGFAPHALKDTLDWMLRTPE